MRDRPMRHLGPGCISDVVELHVSCAIVLCRAGSAEEPRVAFGGFEEKRVPNAQLATQADSLPMSKQEL